MGEFGAGIHCPSGPGTMPGPFGRVTAPGAFGDACTQWRSGVQQALDAQEFDAVFTAAIATTPYSSAGFDSSFDAAVAGYRESWATMTDRGTPVVTLVDNPVWETDANKCLRIRDAAECGAERSEVLVGDDPLRAAADGASGVTLLDFTDVYCEGDTCRPVVGGANIYRDQDHLTVSFADSLTPWFTGALREAIAGRS